MIKTNYYLKKIGMIGVFSLSGLLPACNEEPTAQATHEVVEEKKSSNYYGSETELLDVESELRLELLGEEKRISADMVIIEDKIKILLPSGFPHGSVMISKNSDSSAISDYSINVTPNNLGYKHIGDPDGLSDYGSFYLHLIQYEGADDATRLVYIYNGKQQYEIDPLPELYPSTASKYDYLTYSTSEDTKKYIFSKSDEEKNVTNLFNTSISSEDVSKELEALICAIAASVEYLE